MASHSKKRKREGHEVDVDLAQLYDRLASEDGRIRLSAASTLLRKISRPDATSNDEVATVLKRLFRGLCSSRKSARHGFAVALTELLTQNIRGRFEASINHTSNCDRCSGVRNAGLKATPLVKMNEITTLVVYLVLRLS